MPLSLNVKVGQAVQIGEAAVITVAEKGGSAVKLTFYTVLSPILLIADGLVPARFTTGITGVPLRHVPNPPKPRPPVAVSPVSG